MRNVYSEYGRKRPSSLRSRRYESHWGTVSSDASGLDDWITVCGVVVPNNSVVRKAVNDKFYYKKSDASLEEIARFAKSVTLRSHYWGFVNRVLHTYNNYEGRADLRKSINQYIQKLRLDDSSGLYNLMLARGSERDERRGLETLTTFEQVWDEWVRNTPDLLLHMDSGKSREELRRRLEMPKEEFQSEFNHFDWEAAKAAASDPNWKADAISVKREAVAAWKRKLALIDADKDGGWIEDALSSPSGDAYLDVVFLGKSFKVPNNPWIIESLSDIVYEAGEPTEEDFEDGDDLDFEEAYASWEESIRSKKSGLLSRFKSKIEGFNLKDFVDEIEQSLEEDFANILESLNSYDEFVDSYVGMEYWDEEDGRSTTLDEDEVLEIIEFEAPSVSDLVEAFSFEFMRYNSSKSQYEFSKLDTMNEERFLKEAFDIRFDHVDEFLKEHSEPDEPYDYTRY